MKGSSNRDAASLFRLFSVFKQARGWRVYTTIQASEMGIATNWLAMPADALDVETALLRAEPSPLTIAILTIVSLVELSVSAVYTASPLSGDGVSIDVEYIPAKLLRRG